MRRLWVLLMLCTAAVSAAAHECAVPSASHAQTLCTQAQPSAPRTPAASPEAAALKVSARQSAVPPADTGLAGFWDRSALGAPLLVSTLVMLVIALRRGSR